MHMQQDLIEIIGQYNLLAVQAVEDGNRENLGQYMTPPDTAKFMASMFSNIEEKEAIKLLDAGAGAGILTAAVISRLLESEVNTQRFSSHTYEVEPTFLQFLNQTLDRCGELLEDRGIEFHPSIVTDDFICSGSELLQQYAARGLPEEKKVSHVILNPPYKKIRSNSRHRQCLRAIGVETSNLYTGFLAVAIKLLEPGGELVAITPRSFCNGVYFRPFRGLLTSSVAIKRIHIFNRRDKVFGGDDVLQENIIFYAVKGAQPENVIISVSDDSDFSRIETKEFPYSKIVKPDDADSIIHIPTDDSHERAEEIMCSLPCTLDDLPFQVSTGPVVDFRLKDHLRATPQPDTVPLIYPMHFKGNAVAWPLPNGKKSNAIVNTEATQKWLMPNGHYTLVRRFSSKEEKRRVVAAHYDPESNPADMIGLENHLNVFHWKKQGLPELIAQGLMVYLNSTLVDSYFRQFSGHTQVNASDLRMLRYPSLEVLKRLGKIAKKETELSQERIDHILEQELQ